MSKPKIVITGMGWVTPLGHDLETVWAKLLAGDSGVDRTSHFDASTFPTTFSAEVKAPTSALPISAPISRALLA